MHQRRRTPHGGDSWCGSGHGMTPSRPSTGNASDCGVSDAQRRREQRTSAFFGLSGAAADDWPLAAPNSAAATPLHEDEDDDDDDDPFEAAIEAAKRTRAALLEKKNTRDGQPVLWDSQTTATELAAEIFVLHDEARDALAVSSASRTRRRSGGGPSHTTSGPLPSSLSGVAAGLRSRPSTAGARHHAATALCAHDDEAANDTSLLLMQQQQRQVPHAKQRIRAVAGMAATSTAAISATPPQAPHRPLSALTMRPNAALGQMQQMRQLSSVAPAAAAAAASVAAPLLVPTPPLAAAAGRRIGAAGRAAARPGSSASHVGGRQRLASTAASTTAPTGQPRAGRATGEPNRSNTLRLGRGNTSRWGAAEVRGQRDHNGEAFLKTVAVTQRRAAAPFVRPTKAQLALERVNRARVGSAAAAADRVTFMKTKILQREEALEHAARGVRERIEQQKTEQVRSAAAKIAVWFLRCVRGRATRAEVARAGRRNAALDAARARRLTVLRRFRSAALRVMWLAQSAVHRRSAARIQAMFRGARERAVIRTLHRLRAARLEALHVVRSGAERQVYAALCIQRVWRAALARASSLLSSFVHVRRRHRACVVQRAVRAHWFRQERRALVTAIASDSGSAARRIQRAWRAFLARSAAAVAAFRRAHFSAHLQHLANPAMYPAAAAAGGGAFAKV